MVAGFFASRYMNQIFFDYENGNDIETLTQPSDTLLIFSKEIFKMKETLKICPIFIAPNHKLKTTENLKI